MSAVSTAPVCIRVSVLCVCTSRGGGGVIDGGGGALAAQGVTAEGGHFVVVWAVHCPRPGHLAVDRLKTERNLYSPSLVFVLCVLGGGGR
jgi:hypothetical protein